MCTIHRCSEIRTEEASCVVKLKQAAFVLALVFRYTMTWLTLGMIWMYNLAVCSGDDTAG